MFITGNYSSVITQGGKGDRADEWLYIVANYIHGPKNIRRVLCIFESVP